MQNLSNTHQALDRGLDFVSHFAGAGAALALRSIRRARTERVLRNLADEQLRDAGIDWPARRPQPALDARTMSDLMSMR